QSRPGLPSDRSNPRPLRNQRHQEPERARHARRARHQLLAVRARPRAQPRQAQGVEQVRVRAGHGAGLAVHAGFRRISVSGRSRRSRGDLPLSRGSGEHPSSGRGRGDWGGSVPLELGVRAEDLTGKGAEGGSVRAGGPRHPSPAGHRCRAAARAPPHHRDAGGHRHGAFGAAPSGWPDGGQGGWRPGRHPGGRAVPPPALV
ncbi:unnamed protein product, partial [Ectocarpus sp. 4 AP-2014]